MSTAAHTATLVPPLPPCHHVTTPPRHYAAAIAETNTPTPHHTTPRVTNCHHHRSSALVDGPENRIEQPYKACSAFTERKLGHYGGSPKVMQGGWFEEFIKLGFRWVVFLSPTHCPYGANWGNCLVMKHKPDEVRCGHLERLQYKKVWDAEESRCYVGARYRGHITTN